MLIIFFFVIGINCFLYILLVIFCCKILFFIIIGLICGVVNVSVIVLYYGKFDKIKVLYVVFIIFMRSDYMGLVIGN